MRDRINEFCERYIMPGIIAFWGLFVLACIVAWFWHYYGRG